MTDRDEQIAWARERAMYYIDQDDLAGAFASFASDLDKARIRISSQTITAGLYYVVNDEREMLRRLIMGN